MKKARLIIIAIVAAVAIILGLGLIKFAQIQAIIAKNANFALPPESVTSLVVQEEDWTPVLKAVGSAEAVQGVMVSTDLPGIVSKINFESGQSVKQGDLLVQLDVSQEAAQLASAQAQEKLSETNFKRQENLLKNRVAAQSDYDAAKAQFDQAAARVKEVQALVEKKTIRAPFSGVLGIRRINLGQYLQSGAEVVSLQSLNPIYVNFWLPQQYLPLTRPGQKVMVQGDGLPDTQFQGKINAINSVVDESTRNVLVQATLDNPDQKLRPGMFVNVEVPSEETTRHIVIPATAIQYAPYGDTVYVAEDMKDAKGKNYRGVRQQVVKVGPSRGDRVAILSGLNAGEEIVTSGVFKLHQGSAIQINNVITPEAQDNPKPDDT